MNNTKNILVIALITATLVLGTSVIPMQSYADRDNNDDHKKGKDYKSSIIAGSESDKKSASQHQDQDNFCYRGDDCEQANQGQQIVGKDNDAKGFNDQSDNLAASTSAGTGTGNGNGGGNGGGNGNNANVTACIACFDLLPPGLLTQFKVSLAAGIAVGDVTYTSIEQICLALDAGTLTIEQVGGILNDGLGGNASPAQIQEVLDCLAAIFTPTRG